MLAKNLGVNMNVKLEIHPEFFKLFVPYKMEFIKKARLMDGVWSNNNWQIPIKWRYTLDDALQECFFESVEQSQQRYDVKIEIMRDHTNDENGVFIGGKEVSRAKKDSHIAVAGQDVTYLEGKPTKKGGRVNYASEVKAGCKILLKDVSAYAINYLQETKRQQFAKVHEINGYPSVAYCAQQIDFCSQALARIIGVTSASKYLQSVALISLSEVGVKKKIIRDYFTPLICSEENDDKVLDVY
jgi:hypothetical protein